MAAKIIWSPRAVHNLEEICNFIAYDSEKYAKIFAQRIFAAIEDIADFPEIGRIVPEYHRPEIREKLLGKYRIVYRMTDEVIEIITVTHGSSRIKT